jgi:hypothetical protein
MLKSDREETMWVKCRCGKVVGTYAPSRGDGSGRTPYRHNTPDGTLCEGRFDLLDVTDCWNTRREADVSLSETKGNVITETGCGEGDEAMDCQDCAGDGVCEVQLVSEALTSFSDSETPTGDEK